MMTATTTTTFAKRGLSARQFFSNITYLRRPGPAKQMFCFREPKFG